MDNIQGADFTTIQLISKFNKGIRFLFAINIFLQTCIFVCMLHIPYSFFLSFQKISDEKIWVDNGSEFYNRSMKLFLQNNIEIYSLHNEICCC